MNVFISINTVLLCLVSICTIFIVWRLNKRKQLHNIEESKLDVKPAQDLDLVIINETSQPAKEQHILHVTTPIEAAQPAEKDSTFMENQPSMFTSNVSYHVVYNHDINESVQEENVGNNAHIYELDESDTEDDEYINNNAFRKLPPLPGPSNSATN